MPFRAGRGGAGLSAAVVGLASGSGVVGLRAVETCSRCRQNWEAAPRPEPVLPARNRISATTGAAWVVPSHVAVEPIEPHLSVAAEVVVVCESFVGSFDPEKAFVGAGGREGLFDIGGSVRKRSG